MSCFVIIRCMESIDARKVPEGLYERRKQVVRLSKKGYGPMAVAELTGLSWGAVNAALKAYGAGGLEALRPKARGRKTGTKRLLSPEREAEVRKLICDKRPEQMKMPFALWTREAVRQLILERFGIGLAVRSVGEYLGRWGSRPRNPSRGLMSSNPEQSRNGSTRNIPGSQKGPRRRAARSTGQTRRRSPTRMSGAGRTRRAGRRPRRGRSGGGANRSP